MSPAAKNGVMLVVLVGALALAGVFFTRSRRESVYPTTGGETHWICTKCQKHITLSPAEWKDWLESKDKVRHDPNYPGRLVVFWCPDCKDYTVVRAVIDPKTGTWYPSTDTSGNPTPPEGGAQKPAAKGAKPGK
jgi:hypothetical protein